MQLDSKICVIYTYEYTIILFYNWKSKSPSSQKNIYRIFIYSLPRSSKKINNTNFVYGIIHHILNNYGAERSITCSPYNAIVYTPHTFIFNSPQRKIRNLPPQILLFCSNNIIFQGITNSTHINIILAVVT